ncbi:MAG: mandelate racemase/muconate lactonizing enzyme family protein [Acidobacteria bacterium]|nr:mandelate racemase/muconate lactonizing enzyme family protein [Acidobacteriota bacterium]
MRSCSTLSRRRFLTAGAIAALPLSARNPNDVRIRSIDIAYEDFLYRAPIKFGGRALDRVTLLNVTCEVEGRDGKHARGFGSMPMGNVWSWPARSMGYDETLAAMKALAARIGGLYRGNGEFGHPIDLTMALEPACLKAAAELSQGLPEPIPMLCSLVVASPFDCALHDAYGKLHGRNAYQLVGPEHLSRDLGAFLGPEFKGERLTRYLHAAAVEKLPLYHLVGALDPITASDVSKRLNDGLPETLPEWIRYNGLRRIKIKLAGNDMNWDVRRVAAVHRASMETQRELGVKDWRYSLDFNEKCHDVEYVLEFIRKIDETAPGAFALIQYIEQPTARDLAAHPDFDMHKAASRKPVVIDESLTGPEALLMAQKLGYSGAAMKACKGVSQSMLIAALAQKRKLFLCVQDLTCPGASLIESVGLAAHVPGVAAIEANARQYVPAANKGWEKRHPGVFEVKDGYVHCASLNGPGLSFG